MTSLIWGVIVKYLDGVLCTHGSWKLPLLVVWLWITKLLNCRKTTSWVCSVIIVITFGWFLVWCEDCTQLYHWYKEISSSFCLFQFLSLSSGGEKIIKRGKINDPSSLCWIRFVLVYPMDKYLLGYENNCLLRYDVLEGITDPVHI